MNKTRILLIIAIVVSEIFTIIQFRGKGDSAKSYSLLEEQISSETAVVSELSNELETLKSEITSLSGKIDGVEKENEDLSNRKAELEDLLAKKAEEAKKKAEEEARREQNMQAESNKNQSSGIDQDLLNRILEMGGTIHWDGVADDIPSAPAGNENWSGSGITVE